MFFWWTKLKHAFSARWKTLISIYNNPEEKSLYQNHHVIEGARILSTDKFFCEEINSIVISNMVNKPSGNIYFGKLFENTTLDWSKTYLPQRLPWVLSNTKFSKTYSFSIENYTLLG